MNSQRRTLEELTANLESCQIDTNVTDDFFSQGFVSDPIGPCQDFQAIIDSDDITPGVLPVELASHVDLSPSGNFTEHQSWDSLGSSHIALPMVDTQMASSVEACLVRLQAVHGQQLTVNEAILILRHYLQLANPSLHYNAHLGHFASPSMPFVAPVEVSPMPFDMGPGTSAGISMEVSAMSDTESAFGIYDMTSLRRIFVDEDRLKVECLWPKCGRILMKDNHPRHVRECHLRARRGVVHTNDGFHKSVGR